MRPVTQVFIAVVGADEVHGYEAFRFGDKYFVSPQRHPDVDLSPPVLDRTALGHGQHPWARVADTAPALGMSSSGTPRKPLRGSAG